MTFRHASADTELPRRQTPDPGLRFSKRSRDAIPAPFALALAARRGPAARSAPGK